MELIHSLFLDLGIPTVWENLAIAIVAVISYYIGKKRKK